MQQSGFPGIAKTVLTIIGIVLLVIFGTRAASQASSLAEVGGEGAKRVTYPVQNIGQLVALNDLQSGVAAQTQHFLSSENEDLAQHQPVPAQGQGITRRTKHSIDAALVPPKHMVQVAADTTTISSGTNNKVSSMPAPKQLHVK